MPTPVNLMCQAEFGPSLYYSTKPLLDSRASGCYIDEGYTQTKALNLKPLTYAISIYNTDGTPNNIGPIIT